METKQIINLNTCLDIKLKLTTLVINTLLMQENNYPLFKDTNNLLKKLLHNLKLTLFFKSVLHPAYNRTRELSLCPFWAAKWRAMNPPLLHTNVLDQHLHRLAESVPGSLVYGCVAVLKHVNKPCHNHWITVQTMPQPYWITITLECILMSKCTKTKN